MIELPKEDKLYINKVQIHSVSVRLLEKLLTKNICSHKENLIETLFENIKVLIYDRLNILEYNIKTANLQVLGILKLPQRSLTLEFIESLKVYLTEDYTDILTYLYFIDLLYKKCK